MVLFLKRNPKNDPLQRQNYKTVDRKGINAVILRKKRLLLLERINFPFISHSGFWAFVSGAKKANESYLETAYREIWEETGINPKELVPLLKNRRIMIADRKKKIRWENRFFIFRSKTDKIKLNIEHRKYEWVKFDKLADENLLSHIQDRKKVLKLIKTQLSRSQTLFQVE